MTKLNIYMDNGEPAIDTRILEEDADGEFHLVDAHTYHMSDFSGDSFVYHLMFRYMAVQTIRKGYKRVKK